MEVLRDLRPLGRVNGKALAIALALGAGALAFASCAGSGGAERNRSVASAPRPAATWPVKHREHVDLWFHGFALLQDDTSTVPIFAPGYRQRMTIYKNTLALHTPLDTAFDKLSSYLRAQPDAVGAQFLALYFNSWEEMARAAGYFLRYEGDPRRPDSREVAAIVALFAQYFPRAEDREFLNRFMGVLDIERGLYFHDWWVNEERARRGGLQRADSLWQSTWRPALQRFLNHTQQQSGDLIVTLTLGGEGRALPAGKLTNQYAIAWPATADSAEVLLFAFAHEAVGGTAQAAISDHLTPAETRAGLGAGFSNAGLVRGGAILVERVQPGFGARYARWYLALMGRAVPADDAAALDALAAAFPMRPEMLASLDRQISIAFSGI
jgi:hypothetical protein